MVRPRVRIRFCKQGDLRLIGHRDLMRCLERAIRRAGLGLALSEGFHPKPRMTFPLPLAVGIEGEDEVMEFELTELPEGEELSRRLARQAPPGLSFRSVEVLPPGGRKARPRAASYEARVPPARCAGLEDRIARLWAAPSLPWRRPGRDAAIDLRADLLALGLSAGALVMRLRAGPEARSGPRDVLASLELADLEAQGVRITRTAVELDP